MIQKKGIVSRYLILGIILVTVNVVFAQTTFIKSYSFNPEFGDIVKSLECFDNELYLIAGTVILFPEELVENRLVKLTASGDVVWSTVWLENGRRYIGSFRKGMVFGKDTVFATADTRNGGRSGYLGIVKTALGSGEVRNLVRFDDSTKYISGELHYSSDSSYFIEISSRDLDIDSYFPVSVSLLSLAGERLSSWNYLDEYRKVAFRSSRVDSEGNLYIAFKGCLGPRSCNGQAWITKIAPSGEILWTRNYGETANIQGVEPSLTLLSEDRMALSWTRDTNNFDIQESPPIIYILDREGEALDSIAFHGNWRTLTRIQTAANGDIIGAGYAWTDIGWCGWMIRVTSEAELVWEKYIQDNRLSDNAYT